MIRLILVAVFLVLFLVLGIPLLLIEWMIGKFNQRAKDISSLRIVQWAFKVILFLAGTKVVIKGEENVPKNEPVLYVGNHRRTGSFFGCYHIFKSSRSDRIYRQEGNAEMAASGKLDEESALSVPGQTGCEAGTEDHIDCH